MSLFKDFYTPWRHLNNVDNDGIEDALTNKDIKPIKLSESELIDLNQERKNKIKNILKDIGSLKIYPIPIATDRNSEKSLVLDSNHTCSALYRDYLSSGTDHEVPIIEITGPSLERLVIDFEVIKRA